MGEVGIHLEDQLVITGQCVLEALNVGCPQPALLRPVDDVYSTWMKVLESLGDSSGAIGGIVVDHQDAETAVGKDGIDQPLYVGSFVVGGYYDQRTLCHW